MKKIIPTLFACLLLFEVCEARITKYCKVTNEIPDGWSRQIVKSIIFLTGKELFNKIHDKSYKITANYCVILNGNDDENGDDVLEIMDPLLILNDEFSELDFINAFRFKEFINTTQFLDVGRQKVNWKVIVKENDTLIHVKQLRKIENESKVTAKFKKAKADDKKSYAIKEEDEW